jgi:hypothetical protein
MNAIKVINEFNDSNILPSIEVKEKSKLFKSPIRGKRIPDIKFSSTIRKKALSEKLVEDLPAFL